MTAPKGLVFREASHTYTLDGKKVPGVTTLISGAVPKDALKYWSARTVAEWVADHPNITEQLAEVGGRGPLVAFLKEIPFQQSKDAAIKGTDIHNLAEQLVHGTEVEVPERLAPYVESCVRFLDEWRPEPLIVERPLAHREHWWAGKPDLFASLPDGRVILYDYKTSGSGIFKETAFQQAAYSHAEFYLREDGTEQPIPPIDLAAAVWLRPDGYDVIPVRADDEVYKEFRHLAYVAAANKRAEGSRTVQGYVLPAIQPSIATIEDAA